MKKRKENVRIIGCSADFVGMSEDEKDEAAIEMAADAVIPKPFDVEETLELFDELMATDDYDEVVDDGAGI